MNVNCETLANKYRGYILSVAAVPVAPNKWKWDGTARNPDVKNSELVTFGNDSKEDAYAHLKRNIDYWNDPDWTRNLEAAHARIAELEAALQPFAAVGRDKAAHGNPGGNYVNDRMPLGWFREAARVLGKEKRP